MSKRDETNSEEERVYNALEKMQIKPSDEFKERTFQMMQKEVELARKDAKRRGKQIMKKSFIISLSGIAAAIAIVLLLNLNDFKEGVTLDRQPGENQTNVVQEPELEKEEPKEPTEPGRPKTKEIVTYPEGMEEVNTYQLLDVPSLPFTTYIPQNFLVDPVNDSGDTKEVRVFSKLYPYNILTVGFFKEGTSEEVAKQKVAQIIKEYKNPEQWPQDQQMPEWVVSAYLFHEDPYGGMTLGQYNGQYFYIRDGHTAESGDGWSPIKKLILDEWVWRDTGLPLNE